MQIIAPTNCPSCDSVLHRVKDQLFCRSTVCPAQSSKKVEHFCKKLKIKGFGPKTVEKLELTSVADLYSLSLENATAIVGEKTATKLIAEVDKTRSVTFQSLLAAFSIELIGDSAATKLATVINSFQEINPTTCKSAGLGEKATSNLMDWMASDYGIECMELPVEILPVSQKPIAKPTEIIAEVCITGKMNDFKNRKEAAAYLEQHGYVVKASVTKNVQYLICEDESKVGSSSYKKAIERGLPITSIKSLIEGDK